MSLDNNALLKAVGVGVGIGFLFAIFRNIPIVGIVCCCIGWLVYAALGAVYGYFSEQNGNPPNAGAFALGGAISGAVAGLIWGIVYGVAQMILDALGLGASAEDVLAMFDAAGIDIPPELAAQAVGTGTSIFGLFVNICIGLVFYAVLAAIGGAIYGAIRANRQQSQTAA